MKLKDIEELNNEISKAWNTDKMSVHRDELIIYVVTEKETNNQNKMFEFLTLDDFWKKQYESFEPNITRAYILSELERNGWAAFQHKSSGKDCIYLSDPEIFENLKKTDGKYQVEIGSEIIALYPPKLPLIRSFIHEFGHFKQKVLKGAFVGENGCTEIILEYHNIMFNENCSNEALNETINHNFDKKYKRVAYSRIPEYEVSKAQFEEAFSAISKRTFKNKIDQILINEILDNAQSANHNKDLVYNLYREL